ncbi:MAG: PAS domain-containing sensor histidine kinase [Gammaproteobacteria bacterium]|nr:PAS domain-containing sensor histidine kinase [Gammaproteobacteria bacterium]
MRYVYVNDALASINGKSAAEHLGRTVDEVVPGLLSHIREYIAQLVEQRERIPDLLVEGETPLEPGTKRTWRESWYPLSAPEGEFTAVMVREITEEQALASRVVEANRQNTVLMATVAHELRNPLASLANAAQVVAGFDEPSGPGVSALIARQVSQLGRIVEDLEATGQLRQRLFSIARAPLRVGELLDTAITTVNEAAAAKAQSVSVTPACLDQVVEGDRHRLVQVLTNLLSNAIKYTPVRSQIVVQAARAPTAVVIDVIDRGPGVLPKEIGEMFQLYARGTAAQASDVPGSGIGLWLARELVEAHGGSLQARLNWPEPGLAVRVTLPAPH